MIRAFSYTYTFSVLRSRLFLESGKSRERNTENVYVYEKAGLYCLNYHVKPTSVPMRLIMKKTGGPNTKDNTPVNIITNKIKKPYGSIKCM
jgi:hypothetical protein